MERLRSWLIESPRLDVCRFPLIQNTSIAGFDPSLFRIVYSLFVPLSSSSHSCLQGLLSFIHSEMPVYSPDGRDCQPNRKRRLCMGLKEIEILHAQGLNQFSYIRFYLRLRNGSANARCWLRCDFL